MSKKAIAAAVVTAAVTFGIGIGIGSAGHSSPAAATTRPTPTVTVTAPAAPAVTVTAQPPQPVSGQKIGTWSGTGNENTPAFTAPDSGDYVVSWTYSGNTDPTLGDAANFIIDATDESAYGQLPNDIASHGQGSTEVTGASGSESFNVQAAGSWTITVKAAS